MRTGMLWFDNDPKTDLPTKVSRAADYYQKKYGCTPNLCFVHPSMLKPEGAKSNGIEMRASRQVLPNHLWLGVNDLAV
jgi:hypothetical protein